MAKLPDPIHNHTTATAIVKWHEKHSDEKARPHLGFSELGKECDRALWFGFRWASEKKFDGRMLRLFNRGHREEPQFLEELKGIGAEVYDRDPDTKQQHRFTGYKGHAGGSCDGIGRGFPEGPKTWAIVEFKTHGDKSFNELKKLGVQEAKPQHYVQMQMYMGSTELTRALYLGVNKNTDELYSDWIHFDKEVFEYQTERSKKIIEADVPLEGIAKDPTFYKCKMCDHSDVCHTDKVPKKNCRTCVHATPVENGEWHCAMMDAPIPLAEQYLGCRDHLYIPPLIRYAEPIDAGKNWIKYKHRDTGIIFANATEDADRSDENMTNDIVAVYTSAELQVANSKIVGDLKVAEIKQQFPDSRVVSSSLTDDDIPF